MLYGVEEYEKRTTTCREAWEKASKLIPGAVGSAIKFKPPYPALPG